MSFPNHIAVVNVYFAPYSYGGATVVAEQVAQELVRAHGRRVSAISTMVRGDLAPYTVMRVEKHGVQNYLINLPHVRDYAELYDNPQVDTLIAQLLKQLQPDLLHAHCLQDAGAGALSVARELGLPVVLSMHDFWWLCERQFMIRPNQKYCAQDPVRIENCRGCVDNFERAKTRIETLRAQAAKADMITFPSRFAHDLSVASGISAPHLTVWENGVRLPTPAFFKAQAARRARDKRLVFGFVGGPSQIKGWPLVNTAFANLGRKDFAGLLVDGSLDGSWWRGRDISKLQGDWSIYPRFSQDEMDAFYARIDVLLFLSQWKETFGLTIREAAARGIRVIQTDSGGTTEWDGANPDTMLPIGEDVPALQARIMDMLETPGDHPAPQNVTSYADQATAFLALAAPLSGV